MPVDGTGMCGNPNTFINTFQAQQANFPTGPATFQAGPPTFPPAPNHHQATPRRRRTRRGLRRKSPSTPAETRSQRCALLLIIYVMNNVNSVCRIRIELKALKAEALLEEDEEENSVLDLTLAHLERIVADALKYLVTRPRK